MGRKEEEAGQNQGMLGREIEKRKNKKEKKDKAGKRRREERKEERDSIYVGQ